MAAPSVMTSADVFAVLDLLDRAGVTAWLDGGWGVDALLGTTTRVHADLDLAVFLPELPVTRAALADAGYRTVVRDWLPATLALADDHGHQVDLHTMTPTEDGGGDQALPDGSVFHHPPPVPGVIDGRPVRCMDPVTQLAAHTGYQPTAKDRRDVTLLAERFGLPLPYAG